MRVNEDSSTRSWSAWLTSLVLVALWALVSWTNLFPPSAFPSPWSVARGFMEEVTTGRLFTDLIASLFRVISGFTLAVALGIPAGLWLGARVRVRSALLPIVNFFRSLSPLAWIPFAILWFGIGDAPAVFLIFMTTFFPMVLTAAAAVANVPSLYLKVGNDVGVSQREMFWALILPAVAPQLITALRITAGLAWVIVVAAEMIVGRDGLGFAIWDARNGLRMDLLVSGMIVIGAIGTLLDVLLRQLARHPGVRWAYDR